MTATDELRRLLDERGVEWGNIRNDGSESDYLTEWQFEGVQSYAVATEWAVGGGLSLETHRHHLTPAQAIAATLGAEDAYTCEDVEGAFVSGYSLGCLPVGSDPTWDQNKQTVDEHMAELGWIRISDAEDASTDTDGHDSGHVRNVSATLGGGTCQLKPWEMERDTGFYDCMECACGYVADVADWAEWHYCPNCGRKVVDE